MDIEIERVNRVNEDIMHVYLVYNFKESQIPFKISYYTKYDEWNINYSDKNYVLDGIWKIIETEISEKVDIFITNKHKTLDVFMNVVSRKDEEK